MNMQIGSCFNRVSYTQTSPETRRTTNRTTQPVRSVDGDVKLNRALWVLAEEMAKIKQAA